MTTLAEIEPRKDSIVNDYMSGTFAHEICKKYKVSFKLLNASLNKWGIKRRGRGRVARYKKTYSNEELITGLINFSKKLSKIPTYQEMEDSGPFSGWIYKERFGSWNNAINVSGLENKQREKDEMGVKKCVSDEELLEHLNKLYIKYGHPPTDLILRKEKGHTSKVYINRFGSLSNARNIAGIKEVLCMKRVTEQELIEDLKHVFKDSQTIPSIKEIDKNCKYHRWTYLNRFGSLENAFSKAGINITEERKKKILSELVRLYTILKRPPSMLDMKYYGNYHPDTYYIYFSSWGEALTAAGLNTTSYHIVSLDGHLCLSNAEAIIDDFLFSRGVPHTREPYYPNSSMRADWLIENEIYVEFFGLINLSWYREKIKLKCKIAKKENIKLITIFPEDLSNLEEKFKGVLNESNTIYKDWL